ncbi:hypothetical protein [Deinococcus alpinitundrae]|uniref:hypothetical protein n=1 Tax=Deinococcus alpinitundrae TaxID=468913 RepID=UPI00137B36CF|nr:hypothetical protein [Deinococcus alpinitundrae]
MLLLTGDRQFSIGVPGIHEMLLRTQFFLAELVLDGIRTGDIRDFGIAGLTVHNQIVCHSGIGPVSDLHFMGLSGTDAVSANSYLYVPKEGNLLIDTVVRPGRPGDAAVSDLTPLMDLKPSARLSPVNRTSCEK